MGEDTDDRKRGSIDLIKNEFQNYSENSSLRAAVNLIPMIGSSIDSFFATEGQKITQKRIEKAFTMMEDEIKKIDQEKIDKSFIDPTNEQFYDIIVRTLRYAVKTRSEEKIRLYCKVLIGSLILDNMDGRENGEIFLDILSNLTPNDISVAKKFYDEQKGIPYADFGILNKELNYARNNGWFNIRDSACGLSQPDFKFVLDHLSQTGLIKMIGGSGSENPDGVYIITPLFKKLMEYVPRLLDS